MTYLLDIRITRQDGTVVMFGSVPFATMALLERAEAVYGRRGWRTWRV